jgi:hypothetical protein
VLVDIEVDDDSEVEDDVDDVDEEVEEVEVLEVLLLVLEVETVYPCSSKILPSTHTFSSELSVTKSSLLSMTGASLRR